MAQAMIVGAICVTLYGWFLSIRGMIRLYKTKEIKMLSCVIAAFILVPVIVIAVVQLVGTKMSVWIALPAVVLLFAWMCMGYFLESYLRKEQQRRIDGFKKHIPTPPDGYIRKNVILLALAVIFWLWGVFFGYGGEMIETCILCVTLFLFGRSLGALWKYRGF